METEDLEVDTTGIEGTQTDADQQDPHVAGALHQGLDKPVKWEQINNYICHLVARRTH